jgi:SAM-dependent methyltransferase
MSESAPFVIDHNQIPSLRNVIAKLVEVRYSEISVTRRLGLEDLADLQWRQVPMYCSERLATRDPLSSGIDLFLLQGALPPAEFAALFSAVDRDVLIACGLVATDETGMARARASLFPVGNGLIFSDHAWPELPHPGFATVPFNHVMSIGRDSRNLARCTTRRQFRTALDLCTGSGVHALLASRHAKRVCAVDINPRAADCAHFNAQASSITNLEVALGDLYDAVPDGSFDLITANPPFVPSPLESLLFRDGGRSGEDIQKRIIAGLPRHLAPGGVAQIVTELGLRDQDDDESLTHRLRDWLDGAAMDIHVLRLGEHTAMEYAIGHAKGDTYHAFLSSIDEWAANLRAQGYMSIASLIISFQWSDATCGPPWERIDSSPPPRRPAGAEIDQVFESERMTRRLDWQHVLTHSWLRRTGPTALLDAQVLGSDIPARTKATLLGRSLRIEHQLDPIERQLLERMDKKGRTAVRDLIIFSGTRNVDELAALEATRSLLRRQLISY